MSVRGDAVVHLDGKEVKLRVTLGALAEIEDTLGLDTATHAFDQVAAGSAKAMTAVLRALAKAGGAPIAEDDLSAMDFSEAQAALIEALNAAFPDAAEGDDAKKP